jgi:hypothetical protein
MRLAISFAIALAACGNVKANHLPDAPPGDDAPGIDAASPLVKVTSLTMTGDGQPDLNVTVIFEDATGNLISDDPVDANGKVQAEMPDGGNVVVVRTPTDTPSTLNATVQVITGVKPGDDLTLGLKAFGNDQASGGQTTMTASFTPVAGAGTTTFFTKCGSFPPNVTAGPPNVTLTFHDSCHGATFDLLMVASGGSLLTPVFTKVVGITHTNGGTFTIPAGTTTMQNFTITAQNIDAQVAGLSASRAGLLDDAPVGQQDVTVATPVAGTNTIVVPFEQGLGTRSGVAVNWSRTDATNVQGLQVTTTTLLNNITMDVAPLELPWVTNVASTTSGMTWTTVAPGKDTDGLMLEWAGKWTTVEKLTTTTIWIVFGAPSATGAALPPLPTKYARLDPHQQTATVTVTGALGALEDYDVINGYDEFRQQAPTLFLSGLLPNLAQFDGMAVQRSVTAIQAKPGLR